MLFLKKIGIFLALFLFPPPNPSLSKSPCWNGPFGQVGGWVLPTLVSVSLFGHMQRDCTSSTCTDQNCKSVIYAWEHTQNSKFTTCWAIHYPDIRIKGFLPARQTQGEMGQSLELPGADTLRDQTTTPPPALLAPRT